ncbi:polynucleotide adenylyltransferase PcnB [Gammaproteobacteria bacterium]|nr:polynucleotide adenylyltransferase PcnB [Gammaproteobacteria bacterium]
MVHKNQKKISPEIYHKSQHNIDPNHINKNAKDVINFLKRSGYKAYIVGGGVRDLLLGKKPKDFDIATNATPEQIKKALPRSRIIGRRFKLVHYRKGREIIEVATFRTGGNKKATKSSKGLVLRDNTYGNIQDDAFRRDFKINALYLDIHSMEIIDYTGGYKDLENRKLSCIGDSKVRFREDPVRIIRAIRFMSSIELDCTDSLKADIYGLANLLEEVPTARRYEEVLKLFFTGSAAKTFDKLVEYKVLKYLLPATSRYLEEEKSDKKIIHFIKLALKNSDSRVIKDLPLTPAFLFSVLLWPAVVKRIGEIQSSKIKIPLLRKAADKAIREQNSHCFIPNRVESMIKDIWEFQIRLLKVKSPKITSLISHKRFRASYDFLILREQSGVNLNGCGKWWTDVQNKSEHIRKDSSKRQ